MFTTVLTSSRSVQIGDGLTYKTGGQNIFPGSLVRVPLRKGFVEGIVLDVSQTLPASSEAFAMKEVDSILSTETLLTRAQIRTMRWMAEEYCCTLRQAASVFLPSPPWKSLLTDKMNGTNRPYDILPSDIVLTTQQKDAVAAVNADARPVLLFGVTGSGKTEVYAQLIAEAARAGKQSILLAPEILLTEHTVERFQQVFPPEQIAILHSKLTPRARREIWKRIRLGSVALVIGSRSALFAPCPNLGLVIIDEEHEWTYKNEQTPRYHARETAEFLCASSGAKLILGTATPLLESWHRAKIGRYHLVRMPVRFSGLLPTQVRIVDLATVHFGDFYPFSPPLVSAIRERLERREQSILFLNRRGMATSLLCMQCRRRLVSPESNLPLTVHRTPSGQMILFDHARGTSGPLPEHCPSCGSPNLRAVGAGTQRIEEILARIVPQARVLRADSDTLKKPEQMRALLAAMLQHEADILVGTQSVVKGLHLPGVTLAAVVLADVGLSLPHFRAGERVFDLLAQLIGRSGREQPGEVIIQTFRPDALEVSLAAAHRTEDYLNEELKLRTAFHYPPVTRMVRLIVRGSRPEQQARALHAAVERLSREQNVQITANRAPTLTGGGSVWHVLLRGEDLRALLAKLDTSDTVIDVDPMDCL